MGDRVHEGHLIPDETNELTDFVQEPTMPVENAEFHEMRLVADGPHVKVYDTGPQILVEFTDPEGFTNGLSFPKTVDEKEFCRLTTDFAKYTGNI